MDPETTNVAWVATLVRTIELSMHHHHAHAQAGADAVTMVEMKNMADRHGAAAVPPTARLLIRGLPRRSVEPIAFLG